jgi:type 1 glutamine amidotransferase/HEAT repeat protein
MEISAERGTFMRSPRLTVFTAFVISMTLTGIAQAQLSPQEIKGIELAVPAKPTMKPKQPRTILVFNLSEGYRHSAIERLKATLDIMAKKTDAFSVVQTEDLSAFRPENLNRFDAVCFNNTTQLKFEDPVIRKGLLDFVASGKGLIGIHAATDNFPTWLEGQQLWGGVFDTHPWTAEGTWAVKIEDPKHPLTAVFGGKDFLIKDEIYRIKQHNLRAEARVLIGLDMKAERNRKVSSVRRSDRDMAISWIKTYGKGRVFYCSIGHNDELYANPVIQRYYLDGIQFALGDYDVDTTPIPFDPMSFFVEDTLKALLGRIATYQYGESRAALAELDEFIRDVGDLTPALKKLEVSFLEFLSSNATLAGKQFICQRIWRIGTEASVPQLTHMLDDNATFDMALSALESVGGDTVYTALVKASRSASGRTLAGIISVFGNRRVKSATAVLVPLTASPDSTIACAALSALGKIGTPPALDALENSVPSVKPSLRRHLLDVMLLCAEQLISDGNRELALKVYRKLNAPGEPLAVRIAALRGMVAADPSHATSLISGTLRSSDVELHAAAVQLVKDIKGMENIRAIARTFSELPSEGQVQLLAALSHHRDSELLQIVIGAVSSNDAYVRAAAFRALGAMGDASVVPLLLRASTTSTGSEQEEARRGLYDLHASGVDDAIVHAVAGSKSNEKVELVRAIGEREMRSALGLVLQTAKDPSLPVRIESAKALRVLAGEEQLPAMVQLLTRARDEAERHEVEIALVAVARRVSDPRAQDQALLSVYPSVKNQATRTSFIYVLGKIGAPGSLPALRKVLADKNAEVRLAAIRALSEWPTAEPYADLWKVATRAKERTHRTLALRGSVRLIGLDAKRSPEESVKLYRDAMKVAPSTEELKLLLSAVGEAGSLAAFQLAAGYLNDKNLQEEAEAAVVKIGEGIADSSGASVAPVLKQVLQSSKNETLVQRAKRIIQNIDSQRRTP